MRKRKQITPYVVDVKQRRDYLSIFLFIIIISFGLGYIFGYLNGMSAETTGKTADNQETAPSPAGKSVSVQTTKPGQKSSYNSIEKNSPNGQQLVSKEVTSNSLQATKDVKPKSPSPISAKPANPQKKLTKSNTAVIKSAPQIRTLKAKKNQIEVTNKAPTIGPNKKVKESAKSTEKNPTQYLVQVGLFARKKNASSFIEKLKKSGFEGYFEGFISTSGVEKYNVRLGPFTEKSTAQEKMSKFQKAHNSSAYILTHK